jgi:uncharacterized protein DUF3597
MSIFGKIMSSIFGKATAAGAAPTAPASGAQPSSTGTASAPVGSVAEVDVAGILTKLAAEKQEKLDWRKSIVDLMKLLDLDSSLSARKELAQELHYSGDMNDSASMNVWLHQQVMRKLAEKGGKVPEELKTGSNEIDATKTASGEEKPKSVFGKIMSSIFGKARAAGAAPASGAKPSSAASAPVGSITEVDVAGILTKLAAEKRKKKKVKLNWQHSIIDLMKVLDIDSSVSARKELAQELNYSGDMKDTASMNVWLHKQVMRKLAENGGKVPEELKA